MSQMSSATQLPPPPNARRMGGYLQDFALLLVIAAFFPLVIMLVGAPFAALFKLAGYITR